MKWFFKIVMFIQIFCLSKYSFAQMSKLDFGYATYEVIYKHFWEAKDSNHIYVKQDKTILDYDKLLSNYTSILQFNNICSKYETSSAGSPRDFAGNAIANLYDTYYYCLPKSIKLTERVHKGYLEYISDNLPLQWEISTDTIVLNGLSCIKATGFRYFPGFEKASVYTAWFTPDIPVPFGPIDINGLPGLILKFKLFSSVVEVVDIKKLTDKKNKLILPMVKETISYDEKILEAKKKRAEVLKNKTKLKN